MPLPRALVGVVQIYSMPSPFLRKVGLKPYPTEKSERLSIVVSAYISLPLVRVAQTTPLQPLAIVCIAQITQLHPLAVVCIAQITQLPPPPLLVSHQQPNSPHCPVANSPYCLGISPNYCIA
jgi:hypothetical protein